MLGGYAADVTRRSNFSAPRRVQKSAAGGDGTGQGRGSGGTGCDGNFGLATPVPPPYTYSFHATGLASVAQRQSTGFVNLRLWVQVPPLASQEGPSAAASGMERRLVSQGENSPRSAG